jgi:hypothetical protein
MIQVDGAMYLPSGLKPGVGLFSENGYAGSEKLSANLNKLAQLWLDNGGNIVAIASAEAVEYNSYGLVLGYHFDGTNGVVGNSAQARILLQDGTIKVFNVAPDAQGEVHDQNINPSGVYGTLVKYTIDVNGAITLSPYIATPPAGTTSPIATGSVSAYTKGSSVVSISGTNYYITASTKVFYFDAGNSYNATTNRAGIVTGYTRTMNISTGLGNSPADVHFATATNTNQLEAIFFSTDATNLVSDKNYIFFLSALASAGSENGIDLNYYTGYAPGNDTPITISARRNNTLAAFGASGLYEYRLDADGYVSTATHIADGLDFNIVDFSYTGRIITLVNPDEAGTGGYISFGLPTQSNVGGVVYDSNTKFYLIKYPDYVTDIFGNYAATSTVPMQSQLKTGISLASAVGVADFDAITRIQGIQPGKDPGSDPAAAIYFSMD